MQRVLFLSGRAASDRRASTTACERAVRAASVFALLVTAAAAQAEVSFTVSGVDSARAAAIGAHAERVRSAAFASLLGRSAAEPWRVRCAIHVHATPGSFAAAVGGPPAAARGATSIEFGEHDVLLRRIDVMGDGAGLVPDSLDHEIVHVVLADHFRDGPPPRWADEGLAVLFDSPEKQRHHEADFRAALTHGRAWSVRDLLALEDYPPGTERQRVFYGQSAAVVRWLIARRDAATFIRFLDDSAAHGTEAALASHYGFDSTAALAQAWEKPSDMSLRGIAAVPR